MKIIHTQWTCQECGLICLAWTRKCQECGGWDTFLEERTPLETSDLSEAPEILASPRPLAKRFPEIKAAHEKRLLAGLETFDRVVGGGIVAGSVLLVGGDPGIGKSTLILRVCGTLAEAGGPILYASGEESLQHIAIRGKRIGVSSRNLFILHETVLDSILETADSIRPTVVAIDSVQMLVSSSLDSAAGAVGQLRESTIRCVLYAKRTGTTFLLIGHVAKDGSLAGPKSLEHLVDVVLYVEAGQSPQERVLRAAKNRFGAIESGVFIL